MNKYNLTRTEIHYLLECEYDKGRPLTAEEFETILRKLRNK